MLTSALGVLAGGLVGTYVSERALRWVAGLGFIAVGVWVIISVPQSVPTARIYGMVAVVATYILVRRIVSRIAQDVLK